MLGVERVDGGVSLAAVLGVADGVVLIVHVTLVKVTVVEVNIHLGQY